MTFQHHRDRQLIIRKFACIDKNRIFVQPTNQEKREHQLEDSRVFNIDEVTTVDDIVYVDITSGQVFIYRKKN